MFNTTDFNNFYESNDVKTVEKEFNNGKAFCKHHKDNEEQNIFLIGNINDFFSKHSGYQELFNAKDNNEREELKNQYLNSYREYIEKCPGLDKNEIENKVTEKQEEITNFCENDCETIKNLYQYNGAIFDSNRSKYICHPMLSISGCVNDSGVVPDPTKAYAFEYGATVRFYRDPKSEQWKAVTGSLSNAFNFFHGYAMYGLYVRAWFNKFNNVLNEKYKDATIYVHFVLPHATMVDIRGIIDPITDRRLKPSAYVLAIVNDTEENSKFLNIDGDDFTADNVKAVGNANADNIDGVLMNCYSRLQLVSEYHDNYEVDPTRILMRIEEPEEPEGPEEPEEPERPVCSIPKFIEYIDIITYNNFNSIRRHFNGDLLTAAMSVGNIVPVNIANDYNAILNTNRCFGAMVNMYINQHRWHANKHINYLRIRNPDGGARIPNYHHLINSPNLINIIKGNFIYPDIMRNRTNGDIARYRQFINNL